MRYAIISDVHSNLEAFTACLREIDRLKADEIVCLGDIVGYNSSPNECVQLIRERRVRCVMGNHDERAAGLKEPDDFNLQAAAAVLWTRDVLTQENREFLKNLPRTLLVNNKFLAIHGWIDDTDQYILSPGDAVRNFQMLSEMKRPKVCFFGHTHVPVTYIDTEGDAVMNADTELKLEKGVRYLINPGSVGQPRDRDPRAAFVVFDTNRSQVSFHRVEYDIQSVAEKIVAAGLSQRLAERLRLGW